MKESNTSARVMFGSGEDCTSLDMFGGIMFVYAWREAEMRKKRKRERMKLRETRRVRGKNEERKEGKRKRKVKK